MAPRKKIAVVTRSKAHATLLLAEEITQPHNSGLDSQASASLSKKRQKSANKQNQGIDKTVNDTKSTNKQNQGIDKTVNDANESCLEASSSKKRQKSMNEQNQEIEETVNALNYAIAIDDDDDFDPSKFFVNKEEMLSSNSTIENSASKVSHMTTQILNMATMESHTVATIITALLICINEASHMVATTSTALPICINEASHMVATTSTALPICINEALHTAMTTSIALLICINEASYMATLVHHPRILNLARMIQNGMTIQVSDMDNNNTIVSSNDRSYNYIPNTSEIKQEECKALFLHTRNNTAELDEELSDSKLSEFVDEDAVKSVLIAQDNRQNTRIAIRECDEYTLDLKIPTKLGIVKSLPVRDFLNF
ncbi:23056_t:CDS:10 [Racocetra persica]|uniref:23056_t:CDS:1 n=1 Tax=Racocetra persica TaxID=160502 RepID=A0ACA9LKF7_9GLOM|nr:23056_t:CDS:10 [Racocetra persica]